jgi:aminocarboxymuconate-semialdehyde decarboxylase
MIIDVHAHAMPASLIQVLKRNADETFTDENGVTWIKVKGFPRELEQSDYFDLERRLAAMDDAGIDIQVLSPRPFLLSYWNEPSWAAELTAHMNEGLAEMMRESDRLWALGSLPLQSTEHSLAELDHIDSLGLHGVEIGGNIDGKELDDESLEPVWQKLAELGLTVFIHPVNPEYLPRMRPYHLTNVVGNPLDTTLATCRLLLGGVLVRNPRLNFYLAHGGGYIPYLYGRIDHAWEERDDASATVDVLPSTLLDRLYFDTLTHSEPALRFLIESRGADHVVVGTDYPADMADTDVRGALGKFGLSEGEVSQIEHGNAMKLFAPRVESPGVAA